MCCFCPLATVFTCTIGTWFVGRRCSCHGRWCQRSTDSGWLTRIICISIRGVDFGDNDLGEILYQEQGDCCIINDRASSLTIPDLVKRLCISSGSILTGPAQFYTVLSLGSAGVLHIIGYSGDGSKWHRDMNMIYRPLPYCCWACLLHHSTQMNYW